MKSLFPSTPFVIDSMFNREEAQQALQAYLHSHLWQTWRTKGFVGRISDDQLSTYNTLSHFITDGSENGTEQSVGRRLLI